MIDAFFKNPCIRLERRTAVKFPQAAEVVDLFMPLISNQSRHPFVVNKGCLLLWQLKLVMNHWVKLQAVHLKGRVRIIAGNLKSTGTFLRKRRKV